MKPQTDSPCTSLPAYSGIPHLPLLETLRQDTQPEKISFSISWYFEKAGRLPPPDFEHPLAQSSAAHTTPCRYPPKAQRSDFRKRRDFGFLLTQRGMPGMSHTPLLTYREQNK